MTIAHEPEYLDVPAAVVSGLVDLASNALLSNFPTVSADEGDVELLLDALHTLRPRQTEISTLDGVLYMTRNQWDEAIRVIRNVCENAPRFGHARALLAYCLSMKEDPEWSRYANEALEISPGPDTEFLIAALRARAELSDAMKAAQAGGPFIVPESVTALSQLEAKAAQFAGVNKASASSENTAQPVPDMLMYAFPRA
ncbi:hypothetical protein LMG29542_07001 [Paraburkholderia humisilvae]|uniref:Type III secretion protein HrpB1/HrpK n=2 Tax=Paraburkholderia humisilvae TaxID=627669 RepID=A0A6J5F361_9BURK|nr:hypothetical protein LMG29542_07001 [Paraburkholderia humisilvae]